MNSCRLRLHRVRLSILKMKYLAFLVLALFALPEGSRGETTYERELKELIQQRDQAVAAASAQINARFKVSAEQLLRRATQAGDAEAANKIKEAFGVEASSTSESVKNLRKQLIGTTWKAVPGTPLRGGLAETLTFTEKCLEPGGYRYEAEKHNSVTITFTGGDKQTMTLAKAGTRLQFTRNKIEYAYELVPE